MSRIVLFCLLLSLPVPAQTRLGGFSYRAPQEALNDINGQVDVGRTTVNATFHRRQNTIASAVLHGPFSLQDGGYTFTFADAAYDSGNDTFRGGALLTGTGLPPRLTAQNVVFNSKGIQSVGELQSTGWSAVHSPMPLDGGTLTPESLAWLNHDVTLQGLYLKGTFHADLALEVDNGRPKSVKMTRTSHILHQRRVAYVNNATLENGELKFSGFVGGPDGKPWHFKKIGVRDDGSLEVDFPLSWLPWTNAWTEVASTEPMPMSMRKLSEPERKLMFEPNHALQVAQASKLKIAPVKGAANLQLVITQSSSGGTTVDGFIPLMNWAGQAQVYGATLNSDGSVSVDSATMNWLKKEVRVPANNFGVVTLQDPIYLNPNTGRLNSAALGNPNVSGCIGQIAAWEVDAKEFRFECSLFSAGGAKLNPKSPFSPWEMVMNIPGQGVDVFHKPPPTGGDFPDMNQTINVNYQGGGEFDLVFLNDGHWGFEIRTALPQIDLGGPSWMRTGTMVAPKGVVWPSIFLKIYTNGSAFLNFAGQGIKVPIGDTGVLFANPGFLFNYLNSQRLFFLGFQGALQVVDVDPNIFQAIGKLYIDGSGMGKSGGGEASLTGYVFDCEVEKFDVAYSRAGDENFFALTAPLTLLGINFGEASGEVKAPAPKKDWTGAVSAYVKIPVVGKVGATVYCYIHPFKLKLKLSGHEFDPVSGGGNNPIYTGLFDLSGVEWFGTEILDTSKGTLTSSGNGKWTQATNKLSAQATLGNTVLNESGASSGNISLQNVTFTLFPGDASVPVSISSINLQLDTSNSDFVGHASVPVTIDKYSDTVECDLQLTDDGSLNAVLNLPDKLGGPFTTQMQLTSQGVNKGGGEGN